MVVFEIAKVSKPMFIGEKRTSNSFVSRISSTSRLSSEFVDCGWKRIFLELRT